MKELWIRNFQFIVLMRSQLRLCDPAYPNQVRIRSVIEGRRMTMSPLYSFGKPCSTETHNETVKNLALLPAFDRSNHD